MRGLKIRKETASLVKRYEREEAIAAGKFIDAEAEQRRDVAKIAAVRNRLCGLGATISPQLEGLDGDQRQSLIDDAVEQILNDLAKHDLHRGRTPRSRKPEKLKASQWAEKFRVLPARTCRQPGPLRLRARTPYMVGVIDAVHEPGVEEIVFMAGTQVGKSTAAESLIGHWIDNDPGPILLVLPDEEAARKVVKERIRPLIEAEPVASHLSDRSHDNTLTGIEFDSCSLYLAWAGSPSALARRAARYVLLDEVDKYPSFSGREADPISLAIERTQTFGYRRKIFITSTPTVHTGAIWRAWEAAGDKRRFHMPCPHCGQYQYLIFDQVKFPHSTWPTKTSPPI